MKKYYIGILETHPIQYKIPWFKLLHQHSDIDLTVFYCMVPDAKQQGAGFGIEFKWDLPLLKGYRYHILKNIAKHPGVYSFNGCDTPEIADWICGNRGVKKPVNNGSTLPRAWDAFIVNGWVVKSCLQALFACRRYDIPCIVRGEANNLRSRVWWKKLGHRLLLKQYSAFLAIGEANKKFYLDNGVLEEKIFLAPYSADNNRFYNGTCLTEHQKHSIKVTWGIPKYASVFLFCAKFEQKKHPMDLLRAVNRLCNDSSMEGVTIHLLMVGDGELREECEKFARKQNLPSTFLGFLNQSEITNAYVVSDCLVLPSDYGETWGLVVNEAMACGKPAVVSDQVGCHQDLIREGDTGTVYRFGDISQLASQLAEFAKKPEWSLMMGKRARSVINRYSIENVVKGSIEAIEFVVKSAKNYQ